MNGIFISYRRDGTAGFAGRLADKLAERFGRKQVFRDIETIEPGIDFVEAIETGIGSCAVLLVMMGPRWLDFKDTGGQRRIDDPEDFVRLEIEAALSRNVRIIPLLVGGSEMPAADQLPDSLKPLSRRNALELSDNRWSYDVQQLIATLEKIPGLAKSRDESASADRTAPRQPQQPAVAQSGSRPAKIAAGIGALVVLAIAGLALTPDDPQHTTILDDEPFTLMAEGNFPEDPESTHTELASAEPAPLARSPVPTVSPTSPTTQDRARAENQDLDLSGTWLDSEGSYFQVVQSGRRITIVGQGIGGNGDITGRDLKVTLRDEDDIVYRGYYRVSSDANHIEGHYIDSLYNEKIPITARRISPATGGGDGMSSIRNIR